MRGMPAVGRLGPANSSLDHGFRSDSKGLGLHQEHKEIQRMRQGPRERDRAKERERQSKRERKRQTERERERE